MKILIDMNLSPQWIPILKSAGHEPIHWSDVGAPDATDREIMDWASANHHVVFTHDLDFGAILAASEGDSPSVLQIRTQDVSPNALSGIVLASLEQFEGRLIEGALVSLNEKETRARLLPLRQKS